MEVSKLRAALAQPETTVKINGQVIWRASDHPDETTQTEKLRGQIVKCVARVRGCPAMSLPVICYREWLELDEAQEGEPSTALLLEVLSQWEVEMQNEKGGAF